MPPADSFAPQGGPTPREAQIIAATAQGLANSEIAGRLFLSINTVKTYIRTAYRKMDVTSRSQALLWAIDHGLAGPLDLEVLFYATPAVEA